MPILNIKYMSKAMESVGYESWTLVDELYRIHAPDDFDVVVDRTLAPLPEASILSRSLRLLGREYGAFSWALGHGDVFHSFFDGGFLRRSPLRYMEAQLLHLARKRLVVMPYGSDAAVPSMTRSIAWRDGLMRNYPALATREGATIRAIRYYTKHADFIVAGLIHAETLPRWDVLTTLYYPIDIESWAAPEGGSGHDGTDGPVVVVHAPNHRGMKGTEFLVKACAELRAEGLAVELRLLEGRPNSEVKSAMASADIVADQFLLGYALTALEGMSLSKPVMSNLSEPGYFDAHRWSTGLDECPIVNTTPLTLKENLQQLVTNPALRRELGNQGRAYVERFHSYAAMAHLWDAIYRSTWNREEVDVRAFLPPAPRPP